MDGLWLWRLTPLITIPGPDLVHAHICGERTDKHMWEVHKHIYVAS
jgi:hypothetical protein